LDRIGADYENITETKRWQFSLMWFKNDLSWNHKWSVFIWPRLGAQNHPNKSFLGIPPNNFTICPKKAKRPKWDMIVLKESKFWLKLANILGPN